MIKSITKTPLDGVLIIENEYYPDKRGYFCQSYQLDDFVENGIKYDFVQDNVSFSVKNVVRGLHYQLQNPQAKLVSVLKGSIFDVAVDIRMTSPTFGKWFGIELNENNSLMLLIPEGFAHGFLSLAYNGSIVTYKTSDIYKPKDQHIINYNDPDIGINWNTLCSISSNDFILSNLDKTASFLSEKDPEELFK